MTLADLIANWIAFRAQLEKLGRLAPSTLKNQRQIAGTISRSLGQHQLAELRKSHLDLFAAERLQTCEPVTVHEEVAVLGQILNWAVDERLLDKDSRPRLPTISVPNVEKPLPSDADYAWYLRTMSPKHGDALQFMCLTGLSPHELERLQVQDYDMVSLEILIGEREDFRVKQASRRRRVPLNHGAAALWIKNSLGLPPDSHPFPSRDALQKAMRRHFLDRADAPAGADGLTPKMMRKWFASKVANEASEKVLQALLGHAPGSPVTRKHYVRSTEAERLGAVGGLSIQ